jgi:hypothetical protein
MVRWWVLVHCGVQRVNNPRLIQPQFYLYIKEQRGVSYYGLATYIKKYLKPKEELWKLRYFNMQKFNLQKKSSKRNQNPLRYYNSTPNLKFQHKPTYRLSKILL